MGNIISTNNTPTTNEQDSVYNEKQAHFDDLADSQRLLQNLKLRTSTAEASETVKIDSCKSWENALLEDPKNRLAVDAFSKSDITNTLSSRSARIADHNIFNLVASNVEDITSQDSSGRCWLFATTNLLRNDIKKQLNLSDFQLSQSYLSFWDRIEKSNQYLEHSIELADEPIGSRTVDYINSGPIGDGGQFDMAVNLVNKYGVVPQSVYPESYNSSNSGKINSLLTTKLREGALELRKLSKSASQVSPTSADRIVRRRKNELLEEIYGAAVIAFGPPPSANEEFTFEYKDKNDKVHSITTTPLGFANKYLSNFRINDWYSLINDPRNEYSKLYTVDKLQNVVGGRPVLYVNTTAERLVDAVVTHLKNGKPVFFGCDVGKFSERNGGLLDPKLFDYELAFNLKLGLTKAERLATGESSMTHAMAINAAHIVDGKVQRFRIENSWGKSAGQDGYYICTVDWFKEFVYQVVVNRQIAPKDLTTIFDKPEDAHVLPCYDPMGALA
ncbi:bleomycin hydrolase [Wallemia mellicola]|nr:bleomycin hydrolase [Wallemia mellicola]